MAEMNSILQTAIVIPVAVVAVGVIGYLVALGRLVKRVYPAPASPPAAIIPSDTPPLDPVVLEIIKSIDQETDKWDLKDDRVAFRNDYVAISVFADEVIISPDYVRNSRDRVPVKGKHNAEAVAQAIRLAKARTEDAQSNTSYDDLRRKFGV